MSRNTRRHKQFIMLAILLFVIGIVYAVVQEKIPMGSGALLAVGSVAPDFSAVSSDGESVNLKLMSASNNVVLVFYPADETPGCTAQLCAIRDNWSALQQAGVKVFGVNPAGKEKHAQFKLKQRLPFPLLVDTGGKIAAEYGCKMWFGLIRRTVYVVGKDGKIRFARRGAPSPAEMLQSLK